MKRRMAVVGLLVTILAAGFWAPKPWRRRPNILLITVETLRRDHCSLYGYERDTTPFLRKLAKESIVFDNAWSMSSWTYPSMACVLSGRGPEETGVWHAASEPQAPILWWLPRLEKAGYNPAAFTTNRFVDRLMVPAAGWARYEHVAHYSMANALRMRRLIARWVGWVTQEDRRPWCVVSHWLDPHDPYDAPKVCRGLYSGGYLGPLRDAAPLKHETLARQAAQLTKADLAYAHGRYDEEIHYVDRTLAALVADLRGKGQWENTCLILTADHGEAFGERGHWGHGYPPYDDQTAVPFLVRLPGGKYGGTRTDALVGGIDVLPTLLAQAGVRMPRDLPGVDAVSLLKDPRPSRTLRQHHIPLDWQDEEHTTYVLTARFEGVVCGHSHTVEELPLAPDEVTPQAGDPTVLADLRDLGYL